MDYSWSAQGNGRATQFLSRVLSRGELSHAYLFVGGRDSEAKTIGREFVAHITNPENVITIDQGYNKDGDEVRGITIFQIRKLIKALSTGSFDLTQRVVVIDPPEFLSAEAGNALLKIIEEPPKSTIFVLYAERAEAMLPTVVSRCQLIRCYTPNHVQAGQMSEIDEGVADFIAAPLYTQLRLLPELEPTILEAIERWIDTSLDQENSGQDYRRLIALADAVVSSRRYGSSYLSAAVTLEPLAFALH